MQDFLIFIQNHTWLTTGLIAVLFLLAIVEWLRANVSVKQISPSVAVQMMNHQKAVVVDLRSAESFAAGHIVGAISVPHSEWAQKKQKLDKIKTQPLILVSANGAESTRIANVLKKENRSVFILMGGMRTWQETDMPLVK